MKLKRMNLMKLLFIVVDSKSVRILGLSTSESLDQIKHISTVNISGEQFLSEFFYYFGEIGTLKNTQHIEIKDNVTHVMLEKHPLLLILN